MQRDLKTWLDGNKLSNLLQKLNQNNVTELEDLNELETEQDIGIFIKELKIESIIHRKKFKKAMMKLNNINHQTNQHIQNNSPYPPEPGSIGFNDDEKQNDIHNNNQYNNQPQYNHNNMYNNQNIQQMMSLQQQTFEMKLQFHAFKQQTEMERERMKLEAEREKERLRLDAERQKERLKSEAERERLKLEQQLEKQKMQNKFRKQAESIEEKANKKLQNIQLQAAQMKKDQIKLERLVEEKENNFKKLQQQKDELLTEAGVFITWEIESKHDESKPLSENLSKIVEELQIGKIYGGSSSNQNVHGTLYFQTGFYDENQMKIIHSKFGGNIDAGPKILFGDNIADKKRNDGTKRQSFGGQSKIMGHWDRTYGFGIPTSFDKSFKCNDNNFKQLMQKLFNQLKFHLLNGGDVIVPYPSKRDLTQRRNKYFTSDNFFSSKQVIFHNLGTGISALPMKYLLIIQQNIQVLKNVASMTKHVHQVLYNTVDNNAGCVITKIAKDTAVMRDNSTNQVFNLRRKIKKGDHVWQWKDDDHSWKLYNEQINGEIEKLDCNGQNNSYTYTFAGNNQKYRITRFDKNNGTQINLKSKYKRDVRRIIQDNSDKNAIKYPECWDMNKIIDYYEPVLTKTPKHERDRVVKKFLSTVSQRYVNCKVIKVETLQNQMLFENYWNKKQSLLKLKKGDKNKLNERELFHGTRTQGVMDIVQKEGFRKEFNSTAKWGKGTYMARDAQYSVGYSCKDNQGVYKMFLCSVLCGEFCLGGSQFELNSWPKKQSDGLLFDSLVDNVSNPSIYVIHDDVRAYSKFVIHFTLQ